MDGINRARRSLEIVATLVHGTRTIGITRPRAELPALAPSGDAPANPHDDARIHEEEISDGAKHSEAFQSCRWRSLRRLSESRSDPRGRLQLPAGALTASGWSRQVSTATSVIRSIRTATGRSARSRSRHFPPARSTSSTTTRRSVPE